MNRLNPKVTREIKDFLETYADIIEVELMRRWSVINDGKLSFSLEIRYVEK